MKKFDTLTAVAAPLPLINVDTDMIIPARFLKTIKVQMPPNWLLVLGLVVQNVFISGAGWVDFTCWPTQWPRYIKHWAIEPAWRITVYSCEYTRISFDFLSGLISNYAKHVNRIRHPLTS